MHHYGRDDDRVDRAGGIFLGELRTPREDPDGDESTSGRCYEERALLGNNGTPTPALRGPPRVNASVCPPWRDTGPRRVGMVFVAYAGPVCPAAATACCAYRPTFIRCLSMNPPPPPPPPPPRRRRRPHFFFTGGPPVIHIHTPHPQTVGRVTLSFGQDTSTLCLSIFAHVKIYSIYSSPLRPFSLHC